MVVLVLSPAFLDDTWSELGELLTSHARVLAGDGRLVPLLLERCQLPLRLDFLTPVDCTRPERHPAGVARLREHLHRADLATAGRSGSRARTRGWWPSVRRRPSCSSAGPARSTT